MVDRDVEEPLDLVGVKVAGHDPVAARRAQEIGDEFGSDAHAGTVLAVLAGPSEIRHHRDYLVGGCALGGIDAEQQFHQVVRRREGALDEEHRCAADAVAV